MASDCTPEPLRSLAFTAAAILLGLSCLATAPAVVARSATVADPAPSSASPRALPSGSAYAVIRTLTLPNDGLDVATGPDLGDSIYLTSGDNWGGQLLRIDPVTLAETGRVAVGQYPKGLAVTADDTVYVVNALSNTMNVVRGASMTVDDTVAVPAEPQSVGISRLSDDTVFVSTGSSQKIATINTRSRTVVAQAALGMGASPFGVAVARDDSVYVTSYAGNRVRLFNPVTATVTDATVGSGPVGVVISADDTVFYANQAGNTVKGFRVGAAGVQTSVAVTDPMGLALSHDDTLYVAAGSSHLVAVINPRTFAIDDTVSLAGGPLDVAVTRSGLVVALSRYSPEAYVAAALSPVLTTTGAYPGETGSLTLTGLPAGVVADDSTVTWVGFGDDTAAWTRTPGTNVFTGPIPVGSGTVDVVVTLNGANDAYAGRFTYPPPPPPTPADPPTAVTAVGGSRSATVTWAAPVSSGSYAITAYQAIASPGGRTCLTSSLSCTVSGLTNGTSYTFTVQALTGAGWSSSSDPSNAVTPRSEPERTITITGTRAAKLATVSGTTTGFGMGAMLTPWIRLSDTGAFEQGKITVLVSMDGTFTWERRMRPGRPLSVYFTGGGVRSNTLTLR